MTSPSDRFLIEIVADDERPPPTSVPGRPRTGEAPEVAPSDPIRRVQYRVDGHRVAREDFQTIMLFRLLEAAFPAKTAPQ